MEQSAFDFQCDTTNKLGRKRKIGHLGNSLCWWIFEHVGPRPGKEENERKCVWGRDRSPSED